MMPAVSARPPLLFVHGFTDVLRQELAAERLQPLPALERLLQRGEIVSSDEVLPGWRPWHLQLLRALGIVPDMRHAAAPLEWLGSGGAPHAGSWLRLDFVHLAVGTLRSHLQPLAPLQADEMHMLHETLKAHLEPEFAVLRLPGATALYLHGEQPLEAVCPLPESGPDVDARDLLPHGRDAAALRRLLTEMQMLLHDHPVNTRRERAGLDTANAAWLSGLGEISTAAIETCPPLYGTDAYVRGLLRLHASDGGDPPDDARTLLESSWQGTVVLGLDAQDTDAIATFETRWLAPLLQAVLTARIETLDVVLDHCRVRANRSALRRFWRRRRPLGELLQLPARA